MNPGPDITLDENYNGLEDQERKYYRGEKSILCVKWTTFDEIVLNESCSRLVFYYTQI